MRRRGVATFRRRGRSSAADRVWVGFLHLVPEAGASGRAVSWAPLRAYSATGVFGIDWSGHIQSWNVDPARYDRLLAAFLTHVAG